MAQSKVIRAVTFNVPNTATGRNFIKNVRKYINRKRFSQVNARPRGGEYDRWGDGKPDDAKYFGVYLRESKAIGDEQFKQHNKDYLERRELQDKLVASENEVFRLDDELRRASACIDTNNLTNNDEKKYLERQLTAWQCATVAIVLLCGISVWYTG